MASTNGTGPKSAAARLRELLARKEVLVCPGVYDGFTARIALREGFDCLYMVCLSYTNLTDMLTIAQTGAGTAASRLGMPDLGVLS
jgi:2-methylisocitrate lyase-like PEP mutase family enzyme